MDGGVYFKKKALGEAIRQKNEDEEEEEEEGPEVAGKNPWNLASRADWPDQQVSEGIHQVDEESEYLYFHFRGDY